MSRVQPLNTTNDLQNFVNSKPFVVLKASMARYEGDATDRNIFNSVSNEYPVLSFAEIDLESARQFVGFSGGVPAPGSILLFRNNQLDEVHPMSSRWKDFLDEFSQYAYNSRGSHGSRSAFAALEAPSPQSDYVTQGAHNPQDSYESRSVYNPQAGHGPRSTYSSHESRAPSSTYSSHQSRAPPSAYSSRSSYNSQEGYSPRSEYGPRAIGY
ncbi:unnamed protein product [Parascedosporium putredinis]|uniref:Uncharacterized protein n=1 Tax=Parascedosporium putredinis TaxID=1442378 RepID=A0A9P1H6P5_9PEZI|nr:unnamed protein product [Parascedosporium putredinis]CAI8000516.1 unnamed protein product [Parascedosporium putredinis]